MERIKTFGKYALIIIAFYIISNILISASIKSTYAPITGYDKIKQSGIKVEISDAKATFVNGYVEGKILNETEEVIENQYLRIDLYSKRKVCLGSKYVKIEDLSSNESQEFKMGFKVRDAEYYEFSLTSEIKEVEEQQFISEEMGTLLIFSTVLLLCFFG